MQWLGQRFLILTTFSKSCLDYLLLKHAFMFLVFSALHRATFLGLKKYTCSCAPLRLFSEIKNYDSQKPKPLRISKELFSAYHCTIPQKYTRI